jgi:hypothetical protein
MNEMEKLDETPTQGLIDSIVPVVEKESRKNSAAEKIIVEHDMPEQQLCDGPTLTGMIARMDLTPPHRDLVTGLIKHLLAGGTYKSFLDPINVSWDELSAICYGKPALWKAIDSAYYAARIQRLRRLEGEAMRRAVEGVTNPIYQGKEHVGDRQEYSDDLMKLMLKAHDPDTYAERNKVEHAGVMVNLNVEGVVRGK